MTHLGYIDPHESCRAKLIRHAEEQQQLDKLSCIVKGSRREHPHDPHARFWARVDAHTAETNFAEMTEMTTEEILRAWSR